MSALKSKPLSRKYVDDYDSDDGFVEDAPASKKTKREPKQKKELSQGVQKDDDGNEYWEISGKRRVQISEFKKMTFVGIREFYEKDGKALPGKKGISLSVEQYTAFVELMPEIEKALKAKDVDVPRPKYDGAAQTDAEAEEVVNEYDDDDEEEEPVPKKKAKGKLEKFKIKSNHEATSDEDDD